MSAAALLAETRAAGLSIRLADGKLELAGNPSADLLARLREVRADLIEILGGDRCRHCGEQMAWPDPAGVVFGDGTAAHTNCFEEAEAGRLVAAAERALAGV